MATTTRPIWVLPGEQWNTGQTQLQYEQAGGKLATGVSSVLTPVSTVPTSTPTLAPIPALTPITPTPTVTKTAVVGLPGSSAEYDKWIAQGRTFTGGKWYEPTTPVSGVTTTTPTLETISKGVQEVTSQLPTLQKNIQGLAQATPLTIEEAKKMLGRELTADEISGIQRGVITRDFLTARISAGMGVDITPPGEVSLTTGEPPTLPSTPDYSGYFTSLATELANSRTSLEKAYTDQITSLKSQQETLQSKIDNYLGKETEALGNVQALTQPWQADLEKSERTRLKIEENYFANQDSIKELNDLLTQAMTDIQSAESVTGLGAIRTPRINQIKTEYEARAGVIQAVMVARNDQISVANNLIDRTATAITNDKNAQISYYNTVLNFYDKLRGEEGDKLITLTEQERTYTNAQIGLLQNDLDNAQKTADYVKQLMIDPNTAEAMSQAGVTLNDSVAQINAKLAAYAYTKSVRDTSNEMGTKGYTALLPQEVATKPVEEVTAMTDSKGNKTYWWKKAEVKEYKPPTSYEEWELAGGQQGTGKTYSQWLEKTTRSDITDLQRNLDNYATRLNAGEPLSSVPAQFQPYLLQVKDLYSPTGLKWEALKMTEEDYGIINQAISSPVTSNINQQFFDDKMAGMPYEDAIRLYERDLGKEFIDRYYSVTKPKTTSTTPSSEISPLTISEKEGKIMPL